MATMSIRGVNEKVLSTLKQRAERAGESLNGLVVRLLEEDAGGPGKLRPAKKFDDLDALAGTWTKQQAQAFDRDTRAFGEVDPALWK
jgi:hypothetical protein